MNTEHSHLPYTQEAIVRYMRVLLPNDDMDIDNWVAAQFARYKEIHRKLPATITINTVRSKWVQRYKARGRNISFNTGRVIRDSRGLT